MIHLQTNKYGSRTGFRQGIVLRLDLLAGAAIRGPPLDKHQWVGGNNSFEIVLVLDLYSADERDGLHSVVLL